MSKDTKVIGQVSLIDRLKEYVEDKFAPYELFTNEDKVPSPEFIEKGLCFGLCAYLAHCVLTENNPDIPQADIKKNDLITNPATVEEFYTAIDFINHSKWPDDPKLEKEFYHQMQYFLTIITQLHSGKMRSNAEGGLVAQNIENILNESTRASDKPTNNDSVYTRKTIASYAFVTLEEFMQWAKNAKPGDVLAIGSPGHEMLMYATTHKTNKDTVLIGFYDPNNPSVLEYDQKTLSNIPHDFSPFEYCNDEPLICHHIVAGNNMRKPIEITSSGLNNDELLLALNSSLAEESNKLSLALIKEIIDRKLPFSEYDFDDILDNSDLLKNIVSNNLHLKMRDDLDRTLLHNFSRMPNHFDNGVLLLQNATPEFINALDNDKKTALSYSVITHNTKALTELLDAGADVSIKDTLNNTALYYAILSKDSKIVKSLLEKGANPSVLNNSNMSCLDLVPEGSKLYKLMAPYSNTQPKIVENSRALVDSSQTNRQKQKLSYADVLKKRRPKSFVQDENERAQKPSPQAPHL